MVFDTYNYSTSVRVFIDPGRDREVNLAILTFDRAHDVQGLKFRRTVMVPHHLFAVGALKADSDDSGDGPFHKSFAPKRCPPRHSGYITLSAFLQESFSSQPKLGVLSD